MTYKSIIKKLLIILVAVSELILFSSCRDHTPALALSYNRKFLMTEKGDPFFWLGDTGWLLFTKLSREDAEKYLDDRKQKGFNVIQVMVLHDPGDVNYYGDSALVNNKIDNPLTTEGNSFSDQVQYDFWDHIDFVVGLARRKNIYMALVPVWGSNVRAGKVTACQAEKYVSWLAERFRNKPNIIWLNGGDVKGSDSTAIWNIIGKTIRRYNPHQLITYHPFGRTQSSTWFHNEEWLDFNMFQSGHKRYDQDTTGLHYGEDNWRYVNDDYDRIPIKPTLDGEPSYEGIPQGLHDTLQPRWTDNDVRRYAYWSVFAGGCGFTYGNNSVMQFYTPGSGAPSYGAKQPWAEAINAPGASQVKFLKELMLSRHYFSRVPAQDLLLTGQGEKYNYIAVTKGDNYVFAYTYNGRNININGAKLAGDTIDASWFNPRNGFYSEIGIFSKMEMPVFNPPGEETNGNDWVLVLDMKKSQ
jgi:hypothetical protein